MLRLPGMRRPTNRVIVTITVATAIAAAVIGCGSSRPKPERQAWQESRPDCFIEWNPGCPRVMDEQRTLEHRLCTNLCTQTQCWSLRMTGDAGLPHDDCGDARAPVVP